MAASSLGEGIADSLHLDLLIDGVVVVEVGVVADAIEVVVLAVVVAVAVDCSSIFIILSVGFDCAAEIIGVVVEVGISGVTIGGLVLDDVSCDIFFCQ